MKIQKLALALTVLNLVIMTILLSQMHTANAQKQHKKEAEILRGRGFEIVDSQGRIRASITIQPPVEVNGKKYAENVLLRLIDSHGKPMVKLGAAEDGAGLTLINQSDEGVIIHGHDDGSFVKITDKGKERIFTP